MYIKNYLKIRIQQFCFQRAKNGEFSRKVSPQDDQEAKDHDRVFDLLGHLLLALLLLLVDLGGHDGGDGQDRLGVGPPRGDRGGV